MADVLAGESYVRREERPDRTRTTQRVLVVVIVLLSLAAGTLVYYVLEDFKSYADAIWWGFLRLTDPGYLGDDHGALKRTVSTILTVLGYVLSGYDPEAAVALQQTFVRLSEGQSDRGWLAGLFASHPPSAERVEQNRETA